MTDNSNLPPLPPDYTLPRDLPELPLEYVEGEVSRQGMPSMVPNFIGGATEPALALATLFAKAAAPSAVPSIRAATEAMQSYEREGGLPGGGGTAAHFLGSVAPLAAASYAVPGSLAVSLWPRIAAGGATGALS